MKSFEKVSINLTKAIIANPTSGCTVNVYGMSETSIWLGLFDGENTTYIISDLATDEELREFEAASIDRVKQLSK